MENNKSGSLSNMGGKQAFGFGIAAGFLVLCTLGFFILLIVMLSGGTTASDNPTLSATETVSGPEKFSECLDTGKYASTVNADLQLGASLGVQGTPATFINGYLISGAFPYEAVAQVIDNLLARVDPTTNWDAETMGELVKVDMPDLPNVEWKGDKNAKVSLVEFSDFECPYCARFFPTVEQVLANYGDKVKFTFRHFPLSFHANAQKAAEAFECAKEQGKWFEMYDKLFELSGASNLSVANYKKAATELGLK